MRAALGAVVRGEGVEDGQGTEADLGLGGVAGRLGRGGHLPHRHPPLLPCPRHRHPRHQAQVRVLYVSEFTGCQKYRLARVGQCLCRSLY